jgi:poly-gamma-glutamate synthesis protein (capsule biosynthesis protein)
MSAPRLRIGFTGDLALYASFAAERAPEARFAPEVTDFLRANHHNVVNVEGPVTVRPERRGIGPTLVNPPAAALPALRHLRGDVANLANNHTMDCGPEGLAETLEHFAREGIRPLGAGRRLDEAAAPVVVERDGIRVGLLAVCDPSGTPAGDDAPGVLTHVREARVRDALAELRRRCDWVVLSYHGGEEYTHEPMPARRRRLLHYLEQGAHVVVAHHAHVVQGWEATPRGLVFYGLGNFMLDHPVQRHRPGTYEGVVLSLSFGPDELAWEPLFTRADREAVRLEAGPPLAAFVPLAPRGRRARWCREAYRVRTIPRPVPAPVFGAPAPEDAAAVPSGPLAARVNRLRGLVRLARSWNYRPVVLGALEHRVRGAVGLAAPVEGGAGTGEVPPRVFVRPDRGGGALRPPNGSATVDVDPPRRAAS